jgi:hypothetical protein
MFKEAVNTGNASALAGAQTAGATPRRTAGTQRRGKMVKVLKVLKVLNF